VALLNLAMKQFLKALVFINAQLCGEGKAWGKKEAEKRAAENALAKLKKQGLI